MEQCASTASLLASVREQERQFEMLSRALEEERRSCAGTLPRPLPNMQNGRIPCDADIRRLKLSDGYINGTHHLRMDPGQMMQESYTVEEDPQESPPVITLETNDDGSTRRTETTVKKVVKTTTTRTVIPSVSDTLSMDGGSSVGGYTTPMDRHYRPIPGGAVPMDYPASTVPRNYHYAQSYDNYHSGPPSEAYTSLSRGARMDDRYRPVHPDGYRTLDAGYRAPSRNQLDPYAAQPQVGRMGSAMELSSIPRFVPEPYGLEDDQRSIGYDEPDYGMGPPVHYGTVPRNHNVYAHGPPRRTASYEGLLESNMGGTGDLYYWGAGPPMAQAERGSMASLDSTLRKGAGPAGWRQPHLQEVINMLNFRLDPVRINAAAYLQHLTYKNEDVKSEVREKKGILPLVFMLESQNREVIYAACGALKNISFGRDPRNKMTIMQLDGIQYLVKLLRMTNDRELIDMITGIMWNLSSHDGVKNEMVDKGLSALVHEVMEPYSGLEQERNGADSGKESGKPRHLEWETALTNTTGCLRNLSSEHPEQRKAIRNAAGLVDSLVHIVTSQIKINDTNNKLVENSVCVLRNLSFHVHKEIPNHESYDESKLKNPGAVSRSKSSRFSSRKSRDEFVSEVNKYQNPNIDRTTPLSGYKLLFDPDVVVDMYASLLRDSKNPCVLEASAGAIQNLCAGYWTYGRHIREKMYKEEDKSITVPESSLLTLLIDYLRHSNEGVVRAMCGALRNLAVDPNNKKYIAENAMEPLVNLLPEDGESQRTVSEETVLSAMNTIQDVITVKTAEKFIDLKGVKKLVELTKKGSEREARVATALLKALWANTKLRRKLEKEGVKKAFFTANANPPPVTNNKPNGAHDDSTLPLIDKDRKGQQEEIPMNDLGPDVYSTLDQKGRKNTMDDTLEPPGKDGVQGGMNEDSQASVPLMDPFDG